MAVSLVAALDNDFVIGKDGAMPWHLPDDLRRFKALTIGKYVLMGYKTALAIGRALPERKNLVLSRRHSAPFEGQDTVRSLAEAQAIAGGTGLMVIGGGEIYREALPVARRLYLTWVDTHTEGGDTHFPAVNFREWTEVAREHHARDERHAHAFDFVEYVHE